MSRFYQIKILGVGILVGDFDQNFELSVVNWTVVIIDNSASVLLRSQAALIQRG